MEIRIRSTRKCTYPAELLRDGGGVEPGGGGDNGGGGEGGRREYDREECPSRH